MPSIHLATDDDIRQVTSTTAEQMLRFPYLYVPTGEPDVMKAWGVARPDTIAVFERLHPGSLVAAAFVGGTASSADLGYNGAEPAAAFRQHG